MKLNFDTELWSWSDSKCWIIYEGWPTTNCTEANLQREEKNFQTNSTLKSHLLGEHIEGFLPIGYHCTTEVNSFRDFLREML